MIYAAAAVVVVVVEVVAARVTLFYSRTVMVHAQERKKLFLAQLSIDSA